MLSSRVNLSVAVVAMTTNQTHHLPNGTTTEASKVKQIQTNANTNTKSTMTNTSTNKTHHPCKGTPTEARKHKTKNKQKSFFLVLIFVKIVNKSFSKLLLVCLTFREKILHFCKLKFYRRTKNDKCRNTPNDLVCIDLYKSRFYWLSFFVSPKGPLFAFD